LEAPLLSTDHGVLWFGVPIMLDLLTEVSEEEFVSYVKSLAIRMMKRADAEYSGNGLTVRKSQVPVLSSTCQRLKASPLRHDAAKCYPSSLKQKASFFRIAEGIS